MVRNIRYREVVQGRQRRRRPRQLAVFDPLDAALFTAAMAAVLCLQWLAGPH